MDECVVVSPRKAPLPPKPQTVSSPEILLHVHRKSGRNAPKRRPCVVEEDHDVSTCYRILLSPVLQRRHNVTYTVFSVVPKCSAPKVGHQYVSHTPSPDLVGARGPGVGEHLFGTHGDDRKGYCERLLLTLPSSGVRKTLGFRITRH